MLIDANVLLAKMREFGIDPRGILHIGACYCEERGTYNDIWKIPDSKIVWVDGNSDFTRHNQKRGIPNCYTAVLDETPQEREFYITSNGQSSSILELGTHAQSYPGIVVSETRRVKTQTLKSFVENADLDLTSLNVWNFDIQGAEFHVLRGSRELLKYPDAIYTEVNTAEVYKGCGQLGDLDTLLGEYGLVRVAMSLDPAKWGDALYLRIPENAVFATPLAGGGIGNQLFNVVAMWCAAKELGRPLYITTPNPGTNLHNLKKRDYTSLIFKSFGTIVPFSEISNEFKSLNPIDFRKSSPFEPWDPSEFPSGRVYSNDYHQYCPPLIRHQIELGSILNSILSTFDSMQRDTCAFLHVRRGDYLQSQILHPRSMEYYESAVARLREENPLLESILIFSDDPTWVRQQPYFNSPIFDIIDCDDELKTLAMMASCKAGAVCANSTFSWWGAFLGAHLAGSPVIVPKDWIKCYEVIDLFPSTWIQL